MRAKIKSAVSTMLVVGSIVLWVGCVDSIPIFKVIGAPMLIGTVALWIKWSNGYKKLFDYLFSEEYDEVV